MIPCPDIVRVNVSSLNLQRRLSPQVPEFPSRAILYSSACSLCECVPSKGRLVLSSVAIASTVNAMINANITIFIDAERKRGKGEKKMKSLSQHFQK